MPLVDGKMLRKIHEPGDLSLFDRINSLRKLGEKVIEDSNYIYFIILAIITYCHGGGNLCDTR